MRLFNIGLDEHKKDVENALKEERIRRRHVKQAIWMHNSNEAINRDKRGKYELPHAYDDVIGPGRH